MFTTPSTPFAARAGEAAKADQARNHDGDGRDTCPLIGRESDRLPWFSGASVGDGRAEMHVGWISDVNATLPRVPASRHSYPLRQSSPLEQVFAQ